MGLLHDIQSAVLTEDADLGPILLKLRLLAARLGSQPLAEWVKYESEGYPEGTEVPDYRILPVTYTATFLGPLGSSIENAPIASYLIEKFAGTRWVRYEARGSIASIDDLLAVSKDGGQLSIDAANLILLLQGKVYADYACHSVTGAVSRSTLAAVTHAVRSRVLELTIELEKSIPEASVVTAGLSNGASSQSATTTTQIAHQVIYGNYTSINSSGASAQIAVSIGERDVQSLVKYLTSSGLSGDDAIELGELAAKEDPESKAEPMGPKVRLWLGENIRKAANGTWKIGVSVATEVITQALLKFYGLK